MIAVAVHTQCFQGCGIEPDRQRRFLESHHLAGKFAQFGRKSTYRLFGIDRKPADKRSSPSWPLIAPAYMHSFGMSKQHLILTEFPLVVNPLRLRFSDRPFIENYRWEPQRGLRFHIVEKDTGRVLAVATGDAGFAFHHVNAFEDGDDVVVDMVAYPTAT